MLHEKLGIDYSEITGWRDSCNFSDIKGHKVVDVSQDGESIQIQTETHLFHLYHEQDCCENVYIESIVGDLNSLIGQEVLLAEEVSEDGEDSDYGTSTWTFYKLASIKGYIDIRFLGESNGCYSEEVTCFKVELPSNCGSQSDVISETNNVLLDTKHFKVLGDKE